MIIALWAYVHGIAALSAMKNVYSDEIWKEKVADLIELFEINGISNVK